MYVSVIRGDSLELKSEGMIGYIITLKTTTLLLYNW